ncbi:MAG: hypothetical protein IPK76_22835 [Lewinellaceae bacterium]|nr:hypothetical protein [Lewinellaceae bacterium]
MIFSTFQAGQTGGHTGADTHRLGTAARHSLDALLTELYQPVTREWLGRHLPNLEEGRGLHLASGNGKDSLMLAGLLHGQTALLGLEEDTVLIQSARQTSDVQDHERMQFVQGNLSNCNADSYSISFTPVSGQPDCPTRTLCCKPSATTWYSAAACSWKLCHFPVLALPVQPRIRPVDGTVRIAGRTTLRYGRAAANVAAGRFRYARNDLVYAGFHSRELQPGCIACPGMVSRWHPALPRLDSGRTERAPPRTETI